MNKKGFIMIEVVASLIVALVVFVILMKFGWGAFYLMRDGGEDFGCTLSAVISAYTKIFGNQLFKLNCPVHSITITENDLVEPLSDKDNLYLLWELGYKDIKKPTQEHIDRIIKAKDIKQFNMNKKIAREMKSCWVKLGRGDMPLFEQQQWVEISKTYNKEEERFKPFATDAKTIIGVFGYGAHSNPSICVVCSTVLFDEKIDNTILNNNINLNPWLDNNPIRGTIIYKKVAPSYYEFLLDDVFMNTGFTPPYSYIIDPKKPIAIIFARTNYYYLFGASKLPKWATDIFNFFKDESETHGNEFAGVDQIYLIPYADIRKIREGKTLKGVCDEIAN